MTLSPAFDRDFAHYEVEQLLGRGAIGTVYLARDRRIGRRVALKTIQVDSTRFDDTTAANDFYKRLQREAEVCGALLHPNLVTLYEAGYEGGRVSYLAMEYIEGQTLQKMIQRLGRIPVGEALRITLDVLRGLEYAHTKGIVHRDIKPANILIANDQTVKIADFGIARLPHSSLTGAGSLMGTPNYISPEQILGRTPTPRADLFSVGAMLFEMLTGAKPFAGEDVTAVLHNVLRRDVPHVSDVSPSVPREVGDFVGRLLAKDADSRPTASEAVAEVGRLLTPEGARPAPRVEAARVSPVRLNAIAVVATVIVIVLLIVTIVAVRDTGSPRPAFTAAQLNEFAAKRRALVDAKQLYDSGRYEEALKSYDAYLAWYPWSTVAQDGRARAAAALDKAAQAKKKLHRRADEDISPSELLRKLKKVFKP